MPEKPDLAPQAALPPSLPDDKSPWSGWWTLFWAINLCLGWQVIMSIGISVVALTNGTFFSLFDPDSPTAEALSTDGDIKGVIVFISLFFICPACYFIGILRPGWSGWDYLGNARIKWWHWPVWGAATIACTVVFSLIGPYLGVDGPDESMVKMGQSTQYPILLFLGVAIGAPLVEEFMFRGVLWRGWRASKLGLVGTLFVTSAFWAVLHVQYPAVLIAYIFCLGLVLGLAREKTGSLWVPVWMHALNNGLATYSMLNL